MDRKPSRTFAAPIYGSKVEKTEQDILYWLHVKHPGARLQDMQGRWILATNGKTYFLKKKKRLVRTFTNIGDALACMRKMKIYNENWLISWCEYDS